MARASTTTARQKSSSSLDTLVEKLNSFSADNYWDLGKFIVEKVVPTALKEGIYSEQILKKMAEFPGFKFPFQMLKQCQMFYTYYPNVEKKPLPEIFYFELATKVNDSKQREAYEKTAIQNKWTISDLQKKIRDDELARRSDERTQYGFELKEKTIWSFDIPDPRFGKPGFKGRLPGQIVANALFYYAKPGAKIVDPMAGSGTTGDVVEGTEFLSDRNVKMYDIEPADERITRANILQTGIPEETASVDYVFLDPPSEFFSQTNDGAASAAAAKAETLLKFKTITREASRILKNGGRVSIVAEIVTGSFGVIDYPFEISFLMKELGLVPIGKVYLPRHGSTRGKMIHTEGIKSMASDCKELLTFEKAAVIS